MREIVEAYQSEVCIMMGSIESRSTSETIGIYNYCRSDIVFSTYTSTLLFCCGYVYKRYCAHPWCRTSHWNCGCGRILERGIQSRACITNRQQQDRQRQWFLRLQADFSRPETIKSLFDVVEAKFHSPERRSVQCWFTHEAARSGRSSFDRCRRCAERLCGEHDCTVRSST